MRGALSCLLPSIVQILDRPHRVAPAHKMLGQLCRPLPRLRLIARLQPAPDLLMPPHAPPNWHALVEGLAIQGVEEPVTRGHRAIRPGIRPAYAEKLPP